MKIKEILLAALLICLSVNASALTYPSDCKNKTLERAAKKNGCSIQEGKGHKLVFKNDNKITEIPNSVKSNNTCRAIIKVLNEQCGG